MFRAFIKKDATQRVEEQQTERPDTDSLLACLLKTASDFGLDVNVGSLTVGLPLVENRLTAELFIRAAARLDIKAKLVQRSLSELSNLLLPAVLCLQDQKFVVLMHFDRRRQKAWVYVPERGGEVAISVKDLKENYTGRVFFLAQENQYDARTPQLLETNQKHWFWGTLALSWRIYRDVLFASFLLGVFGLAMPLFIMNVYDRVVPNQAIDTLWVFTIGVLGISVLEFIIRSLRVYFLDLAGKKSEILLSSKIFEQLMGMKLDNFPPSAGGFASNLRDFDYIREFITSAAIIAIIELPIAAIFILAIYFIAGNLAFLPIVGIVAVFMFSLTVQWVIRGAVDETSRASSQKYATLIESLSAIETIKSIGIEGKLQRRWEKLTGIITDLSARSKFLSTSTVNFAQLVQQLVLIAMIVCGVFLIVEGALSLGALIAIIFLSRRALAPMVQVAGLHSRYYQAKVAMNALKNIMQAPRETAVKSAYIHRNKLAGNIAFNNVSFTYPNEQNPVLKNISLEIKEHERVAILGHAGSGKSTLQKIIMKFYAAQSGQVRLDGIDLAQIDPAELRKAIGYVEQTPSLFHGTLKENIMTSSMGYSSDEDMLKIAEVAGITEFANSHPLGFDLNVGEGGKRLSVGQRQSVVIARAMISNPQILLLDEPTSALDSSAEAAFIKYFADYSESKTLVLTTHRTALLDLVDRVIIMHKGQVAADGPKAQILARLAGEQ